MSKGPGKRMQKLISITLKAFILKAQYSNKTSERKKHVTQHSIFQNPLKRLLEGNGIYRKMKKVIF